MLAKLNYVSVDHHHRDPDFTVAGNLDEDITAVCEPGQEIDLNAIAPMYERPDEITTEGSEVSDLVAGAVVYEPPERLVADGDVDFFWITHRNDKTPAIVEAAVEHGVP